MVTYAVGRRRTRPRAIPLALTKISRIDGLPFFLTHGALRARTARRYKERTNNAERKEGEFGSDKHPHKRNWPLSVSGDSLLMSFNDFRLERNYELHYQLFRGHAHLQ